MISSYYIGYEFYVQVEIKYMMRQIHVNIKVIFVLIKIIYLQVCQIHLFINKNVMNMLQYFHFSCLNTMQYEPYNILNK